MWRQRHPQGRWSRRGLVQVPPVVETPESPQQPWLEPTTPSSWPCSGSYQLFLAFHSGVQLIMGMLSEKPRSGTPAEVAACERVQQKAAVTLARLSRDPDVAREAVRLSCEWCWLGQGWWRGGSGWEQS